MHTEALIKTPRYYKKDLNNTNITIPRKVTNDDQSELHLPPKDGGWFTCLWRQVCQLQSLFDVN
jgi:hypothetical protein